MSEEQFELPLYIPADADGVDPNRKIYLINFIQQRPLSSHQSWQIFKSWRSLAITAPAVLWLGIRTFYYDTNYDFLERVTREEALWLIKNTPVSEFMDSLK